LLTSCGLNVLGGSVRRNFPSAMLMFPCKLDSQKINMPYFKQKVVIVRERLIDSSRKVDFKPLHFIFLFSNTNFCCIESISKSVQFFPPKNMKFYNY
jgi:hypothetical protein